MVRADTQALVKRAVKSALQYGQDLLEVVATKIPGSRWFEGARLNFAENLLRRDDDTPALVFVGEDGSRPELSWRRLQAEYAASPPPSSRMVWASATGSPATCPTSPARKHAVALRFTRVIPLWIRLCSGWVLIERLGSCQDRAVMTTPPPARRRSIGDRAHARAGTS
jgi:hypothetical protein